MGKTTGASEVAAILARLTQEKKIASTVKPGGWLRGPEMEMSLLVEREALQTHERGLIDALFFEGNSTSTKRIREHYKSSGFNPIEKISGPLEKLAKVGVPGRAGKRTKLWPILLIAMLAAYALVAVAGFRGGHDLTGALVVGCAGLFIGIFGSLIAWSARHVLVGFPRAVIGLTVPAAIQTVAVFVIIAGTDRLISPLSVLAYCLAVITTFAFSLSFARNVESREELLMRRRLILARDHFRSELASGDPQLRDDWMPYIIAFGLGPAVDKWVKRFGVAAAGSSGWSTSRSSSDSIGSSSGSSGGYGFSGGGGAFGGAGASGSWALAAGAIASGVAAPSSSGSGGGGGGGSSGGGGGGGW